MNRAIFDRRTDLESVVRIGQTQHIYIDMTKPVRARRAPRRPARLQPYSCTELYTLHGVPAAAAHCVGLPEGIDGIA